MPPQSQPQLTKHGVRDLNGPHLNGRAHNGRAKSCPHFRVLDYPTERVEELREVDGVTKSVGVHRCTGCGKDRWTDLDNGGER